MEVNVHWYQLQLDDTAKVVVNDFIEKNPLPSGHSLVGFIDIMTDAEIKTYVPFNHYAYTNMVGLPSQPTVQEEIDLFKKQLIMHQTDVIELPGGGSIKQSTNYYFYLVHNGITIGLAKRRVNFNKTLNIELIFLHQDSQGKGLGKAFFASTIKFVFDQQEVGYIRAQVYDKNYSMLRIIEQLGFKRTT